MGISATKIALQHRVGVIASSGGAVRAASMVAEAEGPPCCGPVVLVQSKIHNIVQPVGWNTFRTPENDMADRIHVSCVHCRCKQCFSISTLVTYLPQQAVNSAEPVRLSSEVADGDLRLRPHAIRADTTTSALPLLIYNNPVVSTALCVLAEFQSFSRSKTQQRALREAVRRFSCNER